MVVGLAYTGIGGDILPIEATKITPGSGKLILTGKLGKVLTESAKIAFDWLKMALPKVRIIRNIATIPKISSFLLKPANWFSSVPNGA